MQTFLPSAYKFSLNRIVNFNKYQHNVTSHIATSSLGYILVGLIAGILALVFLYGTYEDYKHGTRDKGTPIYIVLGVLNVFVMIFFFSAILTSQDKWHTEEFTKQDFRYPITDSNLVMKCIKNTGNRTRNIPQNIHDSKTYPYKLYARQNNSKCYLGTMKNDKFEPGTTYPAGLFYKYLQYVQNHHLENKFKQSFYFKKSGKYINKNKVQWILTNNHDIDLHLVDSTIIKESKIVVN